MHEPFLTFRVSLSSQFLNVQSISIIILQIITPLYLHYCQVTINRLNQLE